MMRAYGDQAKAYTALSGDIADATVAAEACKAKSEEAVREITALGARINLLESTMQGSMSTYKWIIGILVTLLTGVLGSVGLYRVIIQPPTQTVPNAMESSP